MPPLFPLPNNPYVLAIAGGSCSGKSTLAANLRDYIGPAYCLVVRQDDYYHDIRTRGGSPMVNFDIPEALDFQLLEANLAAFKQNKSAALPSYDFKTHQRQVSTEPRNPRPVIIVEGILLLTQPNLRSLIDCSVYIRCDSELRLSRRLERDRTERGRSRDDVMRQFHEQVAPAHQTHVSPSQIHADLVIDQAEYVSNITGVIEPILTMINAGK